MAHLGQSETLSCIDSIYESLFGREVYQKWKEFKQRLEFKTEKEFVDWMLAYIGETYTSEEGVDNPLSTITISTPYTRSINEQLQKQNNVSGQQQPQPNIRGSNAGGMINRASAPNTYYQQQQQQHGMIKQEPSSDGYVDDVGGYAATGNYINDDDDEDEELEEDEEEEEEEEDEEEEGEEMEDFDDIQPPPSTQGFQWHERSRQQHQQPVHGMIRNPAMMRPAGNTGMFPPTSNAGASGGRFMSSRGHGPTVGGVRSRPMPGMRPNLPQSVSARPGANMASTRMVPANRAPGMVSTRPMGAPGRPPSRGHPPPRPNMSVSNRPPFSGRPGQIRHRMPVRMPNPAGGSSDMMRRRMPLRHPPGTANYPPGGSNYPPVSGNYPPRPRSLATGDMPPYRHMHAPVSSSAGSNQQQLSSTMRDHGVGVTADNQKRLEQNPSGVGHVPTSSHSYQQPQQQQGMNVMVKEEGGSPKLNPENINFDAQKPGGSASNEEQYHQQQSDQAVYTTPLMEQSSVPGTSSMSPGRYTGPGMVGLQAEQPQHYSSVLPTSSNTSAPATSSHSSTPTTTTTAAVTSVDSSRPHKCLLCSATFRSSQMLMRHEQNVHKLEDSKSPRASTPGAAADVDAAATGTQRDEQASSSGKTYQCQFCGKIFGSSKNKKMHIQCVHADEKLECSQCQETFTTLKSKESHVCSNVETLQCDVCSEQFASQEELEQHNQECHQMQ